MPTKKLYFCLLLFVFVSFGCQTSTKSVAQIFSNEDTKTVEIKSPKIKMLLENAHRQTEITKSYDPAYVVLDYPNGDVPLEKGVCTDVVIRAFRNAGVDLQKEVHEDMAGNFAVYPTKWGLEKPDTNIDHRRVPNLQKFFERTNKSLSITKNAKNYQPGDVVSWDLNGKGMTHIGIVSDVFSQAAGRYLIIHNIGGGAKMEDCLFDWEVTGHFRYF